METPGEANPSQTLNGSLRGAKPLFTKPFPLSFDKYCEIKESLREAEPPFQKSFPRAHALSLFKTVALL